MLDEEGAVMTTTLDGVTKKKAAEQSAEQQAAVELVRLAQELRRCAGSAGAGKTARTD